MNIHNNKILSLIREKMVVTSLEVAEFWVFHGIQLTADLKNC